MAVDPGKPHKSQLTAAERRALKEGKTATEIQKQRQTFRQFGEGYTAAALVDDTDDRLRAIIDSRVKRENEAPLPVAPWECRIGLSRFFVPPINISVSRTNKVGSLTGSALRQPNSPKYNSGHTETVINMTLYFPNREEVFGDGQTINFNKDDPATIDKFLSTFRGLIAQFKYAPFLPIRNAFVNEVLGVTGVVLESMTVSTIEEFPFCVAVNLTMLKFNHKVYLPMVNHFDQAIHWGRFRQYMGRAADRMVRTTKPIREFDPTTDQVQDQDYGEVKPPYRNAQEVLGEIEIREEGRGDQTLELIEDWGINFYYPFHTPARIDLPNLKDLRYYDYDSRQNRRQWWHNLLAHVGIDVNTYPDAKFDNHDEGEDTGWIDDVSGENKILAAWLQRLNLTAELMGPAKLEDYIEQRASELGYQSGDTTRDQSGYEELRYRIQKLWFYSMYRFVREDPILARALAMKDQQNRQLTIREWDVPMVKLNLDPNAVIVKGVAVTLGNTIARLQLQMQDEPTHQHIGGQDARIDVSLQVTGSNAQRELYKLRKMYESIEGLARLEHGHGVLGFLGISNAIAQLCGVKYAIPMSFNINTVPNQPHTYEVSLSFTDFDVFQQKREMLTADQQAQLIDSFSKANPFLRLKQLWGMFNAYPDFPLAVRDDDGAVVGHLDPDYYFRAFKTIEDDITDWDVVNDGGGEIDDPKGKGKKGKKRDKPSNKKKNANQVDYDVLRDEAIRIHFGKGEDGENGFMAYGRNGLSLWDGKTPRLVGGKFDEATNASMNPQPTVPGLTPAAAYNNPYVAGNDPSVQYATMMKDMQYRDKTGRMIRAYPTYMLWLIDEGGNFAGVKMFDNFYGLQSVLDFSIIQSEDILGDTMVLRVSNLYSRLSTPYGEMLNEDFYAKSKIINTQTRRMHRMMTGLSDYLVQLDTIDLKPGVRIHMRVGYGANPNLLDTVFNGTVTEVAVGDVLTITAQSDAIELSANVNPTNKDGHTGKIDGNMLGLYMSEPRDLMLSLLTQGSSVVKEAISNASKGAVFSENRFGIRHFGVMLRVPLSDEEEQRGNLRKEYISTNHQRYQSMAAETSEADTSVPGRESTSIANVLSAMWTNVAAKNDYEIFKRNIYPGNGLGVAQFLGGDLGDIGMTIAIDGTKTVTPGAGTTANGTPVTDATSTANTETEDYDQNSSDTLGQNAEKTWADGMPWWAHALAGVVNPLAGLTTIGGTTQGHRLREILGIQSQTDDDGPYDEVSFRAQTHMKSVWDLFRVCAALLPDYIVAVRPFEDRSTIFYGKPHWLYTSGLIPLSTGVKKSKMPEMQAPDAEMAEIYEQLQNELALRDDLPLYEALQQGLTTISIVDSSGATADPDLSVTGSVWDKDAKDILDLPTKTGKGAELPYKNGKLVLEMHLPTSDDIEEDKKQHLQLAELPKNRKHPWYMDRAGGPRGGEVTPNYNADDGPTVLPGEKANTGGAHGSKGLLPPEIEQWYFNMLWDAKISSQSINDFWGQRVIVYCPSKKTACVVAPAETGPADTTGNVAGCSPDAFYVLSGGDNSKTILECHYRIIDKNTPLGPVSFGAAAKSAAQNASSVAEETGGGSAASWRAKEEADKSQMEVEGIRYTLERGDLPDWAKDESGKAYTETNLRNWVFNQGWKKEGIPVNYTSVWKDDKDKAEGEADPEANLAEMERWTDDLGKQAEQLYIAHRTPEQANQIWDEFRKHFKTDPDTKVVYDKFLEKVKTDKKLPTIDPAGASGGAGEETPAPAAPTGHQTDIQVIPAGEKLPLEVTGQSEPIKQAEYDRINDAWTVTTEDGVVASIIKPISGWTFADANDAMQEVVPGFTAPVPTPRANAIKEADDINFQNLLEQFMQFMWQEPKARGWLVLVTDMAGKVPGAGQEEGVSATDTDGDGTAETESAAPDQIDIPLSPWNLDRPDWMGESSFTSGFLDFIGGASWLGQTTLDNDRLWDFYRAYLCFGQWIYYATAFGGDMNMTKNKLLEWMSNNMQRGRNNNDLRGAFSDWLSETGIFERISRIFNALAAVKTGVISFIRLALMQVSHGMSMASHMQRQTNMLGRAYKDSIYYAEGRDASGKIVNPQLYHADNPFTREYGEPVVEIREPFQRIHTIGSFQHIIGNGIIESANVPTVVTATSNGQFPVTVHFDKSAPAEKQMETVVDTGLFIDHPKGWFGIKKLLNPIETLRYYEQSTGLSSITGKQQDGTSAETSAKRIALWHLKEGLKDIYQGEITILGDASIRPYDLVYMADTYERMYGFFEVEQVVHHFTPETGFITSITPNACVTINDPARFSLTSYWRTRMQTQTMRTHMREAFGVYHNNEQDVHEGYEASNLSRKAMTVDEVGERFEDQIMNSLQFTGGSSAVVKDLSSMVYGGGVLGSAAKVGAGVAAGPVSIPAGIIGFGVWKAWSWVRDNLLDQHGCYIQYLTHNGQPMDGNLSGNHGVAVGQQHSAGLILGGLKLYDLPTLGTDKSPIIRTQDVIKQLSWTEQGPNDAAAHVDMFVDLTNQQVRGSRTADGYPFIPNEVYWGVVRYVVDGDTFDFETVGHSGKDGKFQKGRGALRASSQAKNTSHTRIRLAASQAPEIDQVFKENHGLWDRALAGETIEGVEPDVVRNSLAGIRAAVMTRTVLHSEPVALRIVPVDKTDQYGRTLAYVFHDAPPELQGNARRDYLMALAGGWPHVEWQAYNDDTGRPYTYNWQLIAAGNADVYIADLKFDIPGITEGGAESVPRPPNGGGNRG